MGQGKSQVSCVLLQKQSKAILLVNEIGEYEECLAMRGVYPIVSIGINVKLAKKLATRSAQKKSRLSECE